jgi:hypothetical protein
MATLLEKIVDERVGQTLVGTVSVAVDGIAEEIAREALGDETFRRALRELVRVRSQKLLDQLLENGRGNRRPSKRIEALRQHVPLTPQFDHLLRYEASLERNCFSTVTSR